jgi:hypothetical protein
MLFTEIFFIFSSRHHPFSPKPSRCNISVSQYTKGKYEHSIHSKSYVWYNLGNTLRQARDLILGPCPGIKARLLSFNRMQSRVVTGLLTGHNTLSRYLHLMGLTDSPLCRRCGAEDETSTHILCRCEALASLRHMYLGSFLKPEDLKSVRPSGTLVKR